MGSRIVRHNWAGTHVLYSRNRLFIHLVDNCLPLLISNSHSYGKQYAGSSKNPPKKTFHMIQRSHFWAYTQKKLYFENIHASQCSLNHCLWQSRYRSNIMSIDRGMAKEDVVYIYTHNGILLRREKEWNNATYSYMDGLRYNQAKWSNQPSFSHQ